MCPFIYAKKKSKIGKMKIEDFFGRKLFLPHCGRVFSFIKLKRHNHFDRPQKTFTPKIEKFHSYAFRFAVSKVERQRPFPTDHQSFS
jgi:fibrillarin-like rRNA methylase